MRNTISSYIDNVISFWLFVVAGLTPLIILSKTTEFFDTPKLLFLIVSTIVLLGLWIFSWILKGKVVINRTPLDAPLLALLVVIVISTFFSVARNIAIFGNSPAVHGSAVAWITYILLYFITVSNLKNLSTVRTFIYVLYGSALVVAFLSLGSFFHIFLPISFAKAVNFTTTGSSFSTLAILLMFLPLPMLSLSHPNKYMPLPFAMAVTIIFSIVIVLTGSILPYAVLGIVLLVCAFVAKPQKNNRTLPLFVLPILVTILAFVLAYIPFAGNAIAQMESNFPKEIQLPFAVSWKISASAFRDAPFIGTSPATYLFDFTTYKPIEFNTFAFWNVAFDSAYNEFLQVLATLGGLGIISLIVFCIVVLFHGWRNLSMQSHQSQQDNSHIIIPALAISSITSVLLLLIHATSLVSLVVTLFVLAAFMMSQKQIREKVLELSIGINASTADNKKFDLLPILIFILFLIAFAPVVYRGYFVVAADYYHRLALSQANKSGTATYQDLQKAETLNPRNDLYRVDMAQTNFALANALAVQKGPSQQNPNGSLTNQDKQTIQTLLSQSINEARAAAALSPLSARNWEVLALIYRNIAGVANNALTFSLDSYGRAIQRDPVNPGLRVSVGGIYSTAKNYDLAIRFYTDAVNLKPDYANAYYNLALAYQAKGTLPDLQNALLVAQQAMVLLQKDPKSPDYKTASDLVNSLKTQVAEGTKQAQTAQAQQQQGLQNPNLQNVNVSNLQNPPQVTPAPAVQANPNARIPVSVAPSPTPGK